MAESGAAEAERRALGEQLGKLRCHSDLHLSRWRSLPRPGALSLLPITFWVPIVTNIARIGAQNA
jgi:hypothetical protein